MSCGAALVADGWHVVSEFSCHGCAEPSRFGVRLVSDAPALINDGWEVRCETAPSVSTPCTSSGVYFNYGSAPTAPTIPYMLTMFGSGSGANLGIVNHTLPEICDDVVR